MTPLTPSDVSRYGTFRGLPRQNPHSWNAESDGCALVLGPARVSGNPITSTHVMSSILRTLSSAPMVQPECNFHNSFLANVFAGGSQETQSVRPFPRLAAAPREYSCDSVCTR